VSTSSFPADGTELTHLEIRAFFRDPDGHLFEISESRSRQR
jgi:catechol 2,3-dioxygenase-like lactoylglutathione lyase family enzyme